MCKRLFIFIVCLLMTIVITFTNCRSHAFYLKGDEFIQQVKSHKDTLRIRPIMNYVYLISSVLFAIILKDPYFNAVAVSEYCNFKKYYCFYDIETFQLDTIGFAPGREVFIYTKNNRRLSRDLGTLKVINDSLLVEIFYTPFLINKFKGAIKIKDIDSVIIKIPQYDYKKKIYRDYPKENCKSW